MKTWFCKLGLILSLGTFAFASAQIKTSYTVSVVPQFPRLVIFEDWLPLLNFLSSELGIMFELQVEDDIPSFEQSFLRGEPDFAFMNPYHMVLAHEAHGYIPLVSDASRQLTGILVVQKDSAYETIQDLEALTIAFPSPNAFGASLFMRALLAQEELSFTPEYVGTHSNVYRRTLLGQNAAGGGVRSTFNREDEGLQDQLRVLYETPGVRPHPLAAHPRIPAELQRALTEALLRLYDSEQGQAILQSVQLQNPVEVDYETDYQGLESLGLEAFIGN